MTAPFDPLTLLIKESESYTNLEQIEKQVENSNDLSMLPVQPLYLALRTLSFEQVAEYLPKFSKTQREVFLDIDLWNKDEIDVEHFSYWISAYAMVDSNQVKKDFVESEQFLLFLKSRFNIWTFDVEDPSYPDHDNYFLTDDNLLLLEFDPDFQLIDEVRSLIRHLYFEIGVENAYTFLFKMISDSFLTLQEEEYQKRRERLRDFGFVDYMDALEIENPFINIDFLQQFISQKKPVTGNLDSLSKCQKLHNSSLVAFKKNFNEITEELLKITDQKRTDYLQFNFIRLINARLEMTSALKKGSVAMNRTGEQTKNLVLLGFNYLKAIPQEGILALFDFSELYKIGNSLIKFNQKALKKTLSLNHFEGDDEKFLGDYWLEFLDASFEEPVKLKNTKENKSSKVIVEKEDYELWTYNTRTLVEVLPYARKFFDSFLALEKEGLLLDSFYLNYTVAEIDFEAILLSSFAHFYLETFLIKNVSKLGLTIDEYKKFASKIINSEGKVALTPELYKKIQSFSENYGLNLVFNFNDYLQALLRSHLEGYEFSTMNEDDYKHVGGPIILYR